MSVSVPKLTVRMPGKSPAEAGTCPDPAACWCLMASLSVLARLIIIDIVAGQSRFRWSGDV